MGDELLEVRELVAALKHDLAKYVAWRSANYGDDAWEGPLQPDFVQSLQDDVLRTKGDLSAWQVWDQAATAFGHPLPHPELDTVASAVDVLRGHETALRGGQQPLANARPSIRDAQQTIRSQLSALHRRLARG